MSSLGNPSPSGFGGLLRNDDGAWITGFFGSIGISNNLLAEFLALSHGLTLVWNLGHRDIVCYSDSLHPLTLIKEDYCLHHIYVAIIFNIKGIVSRDWNIRLVHTLCKGNAFTDLLARFGASSDSSWSVLEHPPPSLGPLLLADATQVVLFPVFSGFLLFLLYCAKKTCKFFFF